MRAPNGYSAPCSNVPALEQPANVLRLVFGPLRASIDNWTELAPPCLHGHGVKASVAYLTPSFMRCSTSSKLSSAASSGG